MLKFSKANTKLKKLERFLEKGEKVYSFDLLSGHSCPFAKDCLSKAIETPDGKRKIQDGLETRFRCYAASQEVFYTNVYKLRKANFEAIKALILAGSTAEEIADVIGKYLPKNAGIVRIHSAGDFFHKKYYLAWLELAKRNPDIVFYFYTKAVKFLAENSGPANFRGTASMGGKLDRLTVDRQLPVAVVVYSEDEASRLGLEIDSDDSHAMQQDGKTSFALLIHGVQPKGTKAAAALKQLKVKS